MSVIEITRAIQRAMGREDLEPVILRSGPGGDSRSVSGFHARKAAAGLDRASHAGPGPGADDSLVPALPRVRPAGRTAHA